MLRVREDGKFNIVQISDSHMVTGFGCAEGTASSSSRVLF
jgi:hypothetical protein